MEPIIIDDLLVWPKELGSLSWQEATDIASALGTGWRLPTVDEYKKLLFSTVSLKKESGVRYWTLGWGTEWRADDYIYAFSPLHNSASIYDKKTRYLAIAVKTFDGEAALELLLKEF